MTILIKNRCNCDKSFLFTLKRILYREIIRNMNAEKIKVYSDYLTNILKENIDCYIAIRKMLSNFYIINFDNNLYFHLPDTIRYYRTNIRLSFILKVMEYGTLKIKPYAIIRSSIKTLLNNFNYYYHQYLYHGVF